MSVRVSADGSRQLKDNQEQNDFCYGRNDDSIKNSLAPGNVSIRNNPYLIRIVTDNGKNSLYYCYDVRDLYNSTIAKDSKREPTTNGIFSDKAIKDINEKYLLTSPFNVENISNVIRNNLDVTKMHSYNMHDFSNIVQNNEKNDWGQTLLYVAAKSLSPESVKLILNNAGEKRGISKHS